MDITLHQERAAVAEGFQITNEVTSATDITKFLFIMKYETEEYDRVATVFDIETYPEVKTSGIPYYRSIQAVKVYDDIDTAIEFADYIKTRLDRVVNQYSEYQASFEGSEDTVITVE